MPDSKKPTLPPSSPPGAKSVPPTGKSVAPPATLPPSSPRAKSVVPPSGETRRPSVSLRLNAIDFEVVNAARRIFEGSLSVVPGERVVIVLDEARNDLSAALAEVVAAIGAKVTVFVLEQLGERPIRHLPKEIAAAIEEAQASLLLLGYNDAEANMRLQLLELVQKSGLRHAHMVGVTRKSLLAGFTVDPSRIVDAARGVRTRLRPTSKLKVRTPGGTDLEVTLNPAWRWAENVGVIRAGRWENLPSGELVTCPADTHGVFVADGSMSATVGQAAGLLARNPVRFEIDHGVVKSVSCIDRQLERAIDTFIHQDSHSHHVGTIIIGTNVGIAEPTGEIVCDQNLPGLHISLGSTYPEMTGAPTRTRIYLTMTGARGDVDLDGVPIIRRGRYMM